MRGSPAEEGRRWLAQAREDLRWAQRLSEQGAHYLACFLAQQSAEKALKGFLYACGEEVVLGHSVERLCQRACQHDRQLEGQCPRWAVLDTFYVSTRYPNALPGALPYRVYDAETAQRALALAAEVLEAVAQRLEDAPGPPGA
ncbi:MAG TPA: HEPN domain-containing protein [Dehalococcoidia bacterium]|nr:HEPN domain-containing protein [Dehalococcoidia bacterium]